MPRNITIATHWTARNTDMSNGKRTCPGVHTVDDRPEVVYVICWRETAALAGGRFVGDVPAQIHPDRQVTLTRVTDAGELAAFAEHMAPGEVLGTVALAEWSGAVPVGAGAWSS